MKMRIGSTGRVVLSFVFAIFAVGALTILSDLRYRDYKDTVKLVKHTDDVLLELRTLNRILSDAQSRQRGFVITGEPKFLEYYAQALEPTASHLERLGRLVADNPGQVERWNELTPAFHNAITTFQTGIDFRRNGDVKTAAAIIRAGLAGNDAEEVRQIISAMEKEEERLMQARVGKSQSSSHLFRLVFVGGALLTMILLSVAALTILRSLRARARAESELKGFFEGSADIFALTGFDGFFKRVNPAAGRILGYDTGDLARQPFLNFVHDEDLPATMAEMEKLKAGERVLAFENRYRCKDGSYKWLSWRSIPAIEDGLIYAVARDETQRRHLEEENTKARIAAQAASEAKSRFVANTSHEIRTPINGVIGMTKLLLETRLDDEQREYADNIRFSAEGLLGIINDVLDFSKMEAGKLDLEVLEFSLSTLMADIEKSFAYSVSTKSIVFRMFEPGLPWRLKGDPSRLRQVFSNLVGNAIKFTGRGSVTLHVQIASEDESRVRLRFSVTDTGPGISEAAQLQMFKAFSQVDSSMSRKFGGTGLGLSICRELVILMGGEIGVKSREGEGSTFWFELPFEKGSLSAERVVPSLPSRRPDRLQGRVLVAEDNQINQRVVTRILENMGCHVHVVGNGAEAVAALRLAPYDVVLMDCQMPEMDGYEATTQIRRSTTPAIRDIPIIALTANAMSGDEERCRRIGMNAYLTKPIDDMALAEELKKFLGGARGLDARALNALRDLQVEGEPDIVAEIAQTFIAVVEEKLPLMRAALARTDLRTVHEQAHSLKSSARTLGALALGDVCQELERVADAESLATVFARFESALHEALAEIRGLTAPMAKAA